jgi:hypothetical protein
VGGMADRAGVGPAARRRGGRCPPGPDGAVRVPRRRRCAGPARDGA